MERKTIGQFIAALRKVNGMTQRDLAERLNVSDKTVSRWERDESSPDLTLIPDIADLFGVTSDELLRGERIVSIKETESPSPADPAAQQKEREKTERQVSRLLHKAQEKFRIRSVIPMGISVLGLIAAMICNFAFNRSLLGFYLSLGFLAVAQVTLHILLSTALAAVGEPAFDGPEMDGVKRAMIRRFLFLTGVHAVLFGFSLPLCLYGGAYLGLTAGSWLIHGGCYAAIAALIFLVLGLLTDHILIWRGVYAAGGKEIYRRRGLWHALRTAVLCTLAFAVLWVGLGFLIAGVLSPDLFVRGQSFDTADAFVAFMETERHYEYDTKTGTLTEKAGSKTQFVDFVDGDGNRVEREVVPGQVKTLQLTADMTVSYRDYNQTVSDILPGKEKNGGLPIKVLTVEDCNTADRRSMIVMNILFGVLAVADVAVIIAVEKRSKKRGSKRVQNKNGNPTTVSS